MARAGRRRRFAFAALAGILALRGGASAATPCSDEPGLAGLACRVAALREAAPGVEPRLAPQLDALATELEGAGSACARGHTGAARRALRALGPPLRGVRDLLEQAAHGAGATAALASALVADLSLTDALRRATAARLSRHPCPELVEILRPDEGETIRGGDIFMLLRLAPEADPTTLAVRLESPAGPLDVPLDRPANVSATQAWARFACRGAGRQALRVRVQGRDGMVADEDSVRVVCGGRGFALGAEVEVLVQEDHATDTLRLTPVRPLRSGATYAVVATRGLRTRRGVRVAASDAFRTAAGLAAHRAPGPAAYFAAAAGDSLNPFPSERLVRPDGTVEIPDGFTARAVPADPRLDGLRGFLRRLDAGSEEHRGFSPNTPVVLHFDAPIDLESATARHLFLLEVMNPGPPGTNLTPLLGALARERGIVPDRVAVASVFPVEDVAGTMAAIRQQLIGRAAAMRPAADYTDPNPSDARRYGIFRPGEPGFADFFGGAPPPTVGAVARGSYLSPEYREHGRFPARFLDGSAVPPHVPIEFLLAVPATNPGAGVVPPFPTVIVQHGFGGDDTIVTQLAGPLTAAGLAAIGIPAPEHGPRGTSFLKFFNFNDFNAFGDNFRQGSVDLLQLVRLIEAGIDLDGDGGSELDPGALVFLGRSLGGVIGGVFAALEPRVTAAVLNVPGGRLSQIAGAASPFAEPFLARFARASGIPVRVCGGSPTGPECTGDDDCAAGEQCLRNPDFTLLLESAALDWQTQLDPGDGACYARWLRIEPRGSGPKPVLVQEGIGDMILGNPLTEALARAIGLPADRADAAPGGVAGLWRYPPPTGHGILDLPEVRGQAIAFLRSRGCVLPAP